MIEFLDIDGLEFEVRRSARRKTVGITVERRGELVLSVPVASKLADVERIARDNLFWVYTKLAEKNLLMQPPKPKQYVSGEGFFYLGRSYRLRLVDRSESLSAVRLYQGRFMLRRDAISDAERHFAAWYILHGQPWIEQRVNLFAERMGVKPRGFQIRELGYRWGSCSADNRLYFHWRTLALPPSSIEYIIVHELAHLIESNHTGEFWHQIQRVLPDMSARKSWLAEHGGRFV